MEKQDIALVNYKMNSREKLWNIILSKCSANGTKMFNRKQRNDQKKYEIFFQVTEKANINIQHRSSFLAARARELLFM